MPRTPDWGTPEIQFWPSEEELTPSDIMRCGTGVCPPHYHPPKYQSQKCQPKKICQPNACRVPDPDWSCTPEEWYPSPEYHTPTKLERSLCLILEALGDETHDRMFYQYLLGVAPDCEQQDIIKSIRDDEIKHFAMFRRIYQEITCEPPQAKQKAFAEPKSYCAAIQQAIFGELGAVETYRKILFGLCSQRHRDMLFEIISDELKHSAKWNFLYSKNCCGCCNK